MKIIISLFNEEDGHVRIECNPPLPKLIENWRGGNKDPALAYAIAGVEKMMAFSRDVEAEQQRQQRDQEMMSQLILPDPRIKTPKQTGPTEVN